MVTYATHGHLRPVNGMIRKTNKAVLGVYLEESRDSVYNSELPSACIIDAMSFVQKYSANNETFQEVSKDLLNRFLSEGSMYERIDVVFDKYQEISIKNSERKKRGEESAPIFANIMPRHRITQWSNFFKSSHNKTVFIDFLVEE